MLIREVVAADLYGVVDLIKEMHAESVYNWLSFNPKKIIGVVENCLQRKDHVLYVAEGAGKIVGVMGGYTSTYIFCDEPIVFDLGLYVQSSTRGSRAGVLLIKRVLEWAKQQGAREIVCGVTALPPEQRERVYPLYIKLGFYDAGHIFKMRF